MTTMLEQKLDQPTMFEGQRHRKDSTDVPHYSALLEFLDLRAQTSENAVRRSDHKCQTPMAVNKCYRHTKSYAVNIDDGCVDCKLGRHPLYACKKFKSLHICKW